MSLARVKIENGLTTMMIRAAPQPPISMQVLTSVVLGFIALGALTFCVSSCASGSQPVSEFLGRAQSEADARRFEELLGHLDDRPAATPKKTNHVLQRHVTPLDVKPVAITTNIKPKPIDQSIITKPAPVSYVEEAGPRLPTRAKRVRTTRPDLANAADDWMRKGSNMLRLVGARF